MGGRPPCPSTAAPRFFSFCRKGASPFCPSCFTETNSFVPASPMSSCFGAVLLPTVNRATTSPCVMVLALAYRLRTSRFQYGFSAISPAGTVTGSSYRSGSFAAGGGLRNCALRGMPEDLVESTANHLFTVAQKPLGWSVYFCYQVSDLTWLPSSRRVYLEG